MKQTLLAHGFLAHQQTLEGNYSNLCIGTNKKWISLQQYEVKGYKYREGGRDEESTWPDHIVFYNYDI